MNSYWSRNYPPFREDTKGVIRILNSKDRQYSGQKKKKDKWTNNDLQNIAAQKTKD
jgi:hypothetical protein